jgi:hypothetical protein
MVYTSQEVIDEVTGGDAYALAKYINSLEKQLKEKGKKEYDEIYAEGYAEGIAENKKELEELKERIDTHEKNHDKIWNSLPSVHIAQYEDDATDGIVMEIEKVTEELEIAVKVNSIKEKELIAYQELVKAHKIQLKEEIKKLETTHEDELNDLQEELDEYKDAARDNEPDDLRIVLDEYDENIEELQGEVHEFVCKRDDFIEKLQGSADKWGKLVKAMKDNYDEEADYNDFEIWEFLADELGLSPTGVEKKED